MNALSGNLFVFGYGSLVWRPSFPYVNKFTGYIKGWKRRFWQGSTDHRGVPGAPGRVVTLLPAQTETVWGVCYEVHKDKVEEVLDYLDVREQGGYSRFEVPVFETLTSSSAHQSALLYVADETNPNYLGEADELEIAMQIMNSHGPSGKNLDYLLELCKMLREHEIDDAHAFRIESHIIELSKAPIV